MDGIKKFKCQNCGWEKVIDGTCKMCNSGKKCDFKNPPCPECGHINNEDSITISECKNSKK